MEYTLFSVMLCHAWSFSVMDGVGHWGCNSPGDCKFIVLHFYIFPGVLPCVAKKQCSHHIPKITTVDIQPDGKYIFWKNSAVDKRQKSLRLHLLTLNKVFGHDQNAIEGFGICDKGLQKSLNEEKSERDAHTEFDGAVRTKREDDAQKGDVDCEEHPTLGGQEANDEGDDPSYPRNLEEADQDLEKTAFMLFDKIRATIPMISQSITGRGKMIVETAVKNDTARCFPRRQ